MSSLEDLVLGASEEEHVVWMSFEEKLRGMKMIVDEDFEFSHPELDDFLTESYGPPTDGSMISVCTLTPSSTGSSFNDSIPGPVILEELSLEPPLDGDPGPEQSLANQKELKQIPMDPLQRQQEGSNQPENEKDDVATVCTEPTTHGDHLPKLSKLPTPSEKLVNCSSLCRSPVKDTQLESLMQEMREGDITQSTENKSNFKPSIEPCSSNETYVILSSSEERVSEALNESVTSEASSLGSSVSVESVTGSKRSRLPRAGAALNTKPAVGSKIAKPATKRSLLPSKVMDKPSFRQPIVKGNGPAKKLVKPVSVITKTSRLSLKHQENGGVPAVASKAPKRPTLNKARTRKSSIPKPVSVTDLSKTVSKDRPAQMDTTITKTTGILSSTSDTVIHSTPISVQRHTGGADGTPNRRRSAVTETPSATERLKEEAPRIRPSFSLSSIKGSGPPKTACATPVSGPAVGAGKTPRTVTKRRSLLPTAGGKDLSVPPFNIMTSDKKTVEPSQQDILASPVLKSDKQAMPPPKKSLNPQKRRSGLQKPKAGSTRMAFKPRNGPVSRVKKDAPIKPNVQPVTYGDESEMVPKFGGSKLIHSPLNKENAPATPHSKWSPIRKKREFSGDDACFRCTKRAVK